MNYLAKFSTRLSELAEPIRGLVKDKVLFNWGPEHQQTSTSFRTYEERDCRCSYSHLLQPQEANSADRCQHQRSWCLSTGQDSKPLYFAMKALIFLCQSFSA